MSFYSRWQSLTDEDRHTALVFGFLRHAPTEGALDAWLSDVLGRAVKVQPLEPSSFWPTVFSTVPGSAYTEPELVFEANDGSDLTVIVEVKPGYDMHALEQIRREVVDVAAVSRAARIACVMVGADLGRPSSTEKWEEEVASFARELMETTPEIDLYYSSFAQLAQAIKNCGQERPEWHRYAEDVLAQLRRKALLGYEGAPMLDDLDVVTPRNAVEGFNRLIKTARQFYLQLHGQSAFLALGLERYDKSYGHRMVRNGKSETVTQNEQWFETTVVVCLYRHALLPEGATAFAGIDLLGRGTSDPDLIVGRCEGEPGTYGLGEALRVPEPNAGPDALLRERAVSGTTAWTYDRRPWLPGTPAEDLDWAISRLEAAFRVAT